MKKLFLLLILLFCISCSPQISQYKVCESCHTEQNALKVLDAYLNIDTIYGKKNKIYDLPNVYYIEYFLTAPEEYTLRDGAAYVIIRKRDCKVLYHGR